jgi:hypothetical protein
MHFLFSHRRAQAVIRATHRLSLALLLGMAMATAQAQSTHELPLGAPASIDPAEGAAHLAAFRQARLQGDFCLRFQLVHMPRRGDETSYEGTAWGTWTDQGPVTRFQLRPAPVSADTPDDLTKRDTNTWVWLVQNGAAPRVWVLPPGATAPHELPSSAWHAPLFPGLVYTPFDLLMPFMYWPKFEYGGPARVKGRVTDLYVMLPPTADAGPVRVALDREFNALVRAEQLDDKRQPTRQFEILSFEKVQGQWLVKTLDLLDLATRDKDRFTVTAAALNVRLAPAIFDPMRLAGPAALPSGAAWQPL